MAVRERTASLTEGALLAALTALVALLVAVFGSPGLVAAPLPLFVLTYRRGLRTAALSAVVAGLVLSPFFGFPQGLLFVAAFAPVGVVQGVVARQGGERAAGRAVLAGAAVGLGVTVLSLVVTRYLMGLDPLQAVVEAQVKGAQAAADLSRRLGAPPQQVQQMEQLAQQIPNLVRTILPAAVILGVLVWAYGAYALARHVMRRLGTELPGFAPILTWRLPPAGTVALVVPVLAGVAVQPWAPELGRVLAANGFMASVLVFAFFGVLTMLHYLQSRDVPRAGRALAVVAVLMLGDLGTFAMVALGLVDLWLDLRKVGPRAERSP
ncbi:MAG: DUF2232 domain-containing protein [Armatimonadota bacterium]|nr:DUF2232 domain-containing protein [Armatimonadota bacterium]MDR7580583.1 DUF2232 domain-containing protein [Armatimonadota bacterium]MDR7595220.1 DUF2232 domain-containing protein [Armatimonadota bacterium]